MPDIHGHTELLTADIIRNVNSPFWRHFFLLFFLATDQHHFVSFLLRQLSKHLPARAEGYAWSLIYSTSQHGFSLNSLYREMKRFDSPVLLIIEDTNGAVNYRSKADTHSRARARGRFDLHN